MANYYKTTYKRKGNNKGLNERFIKQPDSKIRVYHHVKFRNGEVEGVVLRTTIGDLPYKVESIDKETYDAALCKALEFFKSKP